MKHTANRMKWILAAAGLLTVLLGTGGTASAKVFFKVGILNEPKSLNPFQVSDAWTKRVNMLLYQPLYLLDPGTQDLTPWLAEDQPVYDPEAKTVTFHLRKMLWDDGEPFTAEDVVFTAKVFKKFQVPKDYEYWKFVESIEAVDDRTVRLSIEKESAILYTRTLTSRVVQKKRWQPFVEEADKKYEEILAAERSGGKTTAQASEKAEDEALQVLRNRRVPRPTGLGPFKFAEWNRRAYILLTKNEHYFGQGERIAGRLLGPYVDGVIFKPYDSLNSAALALKRGDIDFLWKGMSHALMRELAETPEIEIQSTLDSGYRFLSFNLRRDPMSDPFFRRAVAYLIDKDFIVQRILHGLGKRLDTVVPPSSSYYYHPGTPPYGEGMSRDQRVKKAYEILTHAGYQWRTSPLDAEGRVQQARGMAMPNGKPMPEIAILSPPMDYDVEMAATAKTVQGWLKSFGIPITWESVPFGTLIQRLRYERGFDLFILGLRGLMDPDYLRTFFHSSNDEPGERNYAGYHNHELDRLAELQAGVMDRAKRRQWVLELQDLLMTDLPWIPLYVPFRLEGVRTDRFEGWTTMLGGVGNHWTFCLLRPKE